MNTNRCQACGSVLTRAEPGHAGVRRCPACGAENESALEEPTTSFHLPAEQSSTVPPVPASEEVTATSAVSATAKDPMPSLPGYEIHEELGRGGMGIVFRATQLSLNRPVALKVLLVGNLAGDADLNRFYTEAETIARVQHPNIVQIFDMGEWKTAGFHRGAPFLALEFCPGGSLQRRLAGGVLAPLVAARLLETLARAVHTAHDAQVIHRDLKPANILFSAAGRPKIADFGLAKKLDDQGQTGSNMVMGTPSYMAPEQAEGNSKQVGAAADIYALGAILYECLTGRPPFKASTPLQTIMKVVAEEPERPSEVRAGVPQRLEAICLHCLRKAPAKRYPTAEALAEALRQFVADWESGGAVFRGEPEEPRALPEVLPVLEVTEKDVVGEASAIAPGHRGGFFARVPPRLRGPLLAAGVIVPALLALLYLLSGLIGGGSDHKSPTRRKPIRVDPGPKALFFALREARDGDRLQLAGDIEECNVVVTQSDLTIEPLEGRRVTWRCPPDAPPNSKLLHVGSGAAGFQLRGVTLDGGDHTEALVFIYGKSPGVRLQDLELRNTGKYGLLFVNAEGSADAPIELVDLTFQTRVGQSAVRFELAKELEAVARVNRFIRFGECRFEGPGERFTTANHDFVDAGTLQLPQGLAVLRGETPAVADRPPVVMTVPPPPVAFRRGELTAAAREQIKRATVLLRVTLPDDTVSRGSGFFGVAGSPSLLLTTAHMLGMLAPANSKPKKVEVVLHSGTREEKTTEATVLAVDRASDLAVLDVGNVPGLPKPLTVKSGDEVRELDKVFVFGFPLGESLGKEISLRAATVTAKRQNAGGLEQLQLEGGMDAGSSGAPVVDDNGDVVGVAVSGLPRKNINFAVAGARVESMLNGRVMEMQTGQPYKSGDQIGIPVQLHMIDPRKKIREVCVDVWVGNAPHEREPVRPPANSAPARLEGDANRTRAVMSYERGVDRGDVVLPPLPPGKVWWVQGNWETTDGKRFWDFATVYKATSTPVERKPIQLSANYRTPRAGRRLDVETTTRFKVGALADTEVASFVSKASLLEQGGPLDDGTALRLTYQNLEQTLTVNRRKGDLPQYTLARPNLKDLVGLVELDRFGNVRENHVMNLAELEKSETGRALLFVHQPTRFTLYPTLLGMPNKVVQPKEVWSATRRMAVGTFGSPPREGNIDLTCTYMGVRVVGGRDEAVISLEGVIRDPSMAGRARGQAILDVATNVLRRVELEMEVDMPALEIELEQGKKEKLRVLANVSMKLKRSP